VEPIDRRLLHEAAGAFRDTAALLQGRQAVPLLGDLEELRTASANRVVELAGDSSTCADEAVHVSFHAQMVATAARSAAANALVATRGSHRFWARGVAGTNEVGTKEAGTSPEPASTPLAARPSSMLGNARRLAAGHASLRSVWFLNALRGAVALAAAVTVAKLTNVQHGFWVVLGALSVLRTSAASTGATALRALGGTALGFFIGAALILAIGSHPVALWVALPLAVMVAGYAPGTAPFLVGQAAFTLTLSVLYNIVVPVGWTVGALRLEDVAIGAGVSAVVGILFWPRGAAAIVGDDMADAFYRGGVYLVQATAWALGARTSPPDAAAPAARASTRLDDALRALLAEQGTKRVPKEQLWRLVGGAMRLRLTAQSLSGSVPPGVGATPAHRALVQEAVGLAGTCDELAAQLGHVPSTVARELATLPSVEAAPASVQGYGLWVREHLDHVRRNLDELGPAVATVATSRARPWWR
jgi:uncharacterized membrane protein YccC